MIVNNNGDTFATLRRQAVGLARATDVMSSALSAAAPHGRNYQRDPPSEYEIDRALFDAALKGLQAIRAFEQKFMAEVARNMSEGAQDWG